MYYIQDIKTIANGTFKHAFHVIFLLEIIGLGC